MCCQVSNSQASRSTPTRGVPKWLKDLIMAEQEHLEIVQLRLAALQQLAESGAASKRPPEFHDGEEKKSVDDGEDNNSVDDTLD